MAPEEHSCIARKEIYLLLRMLQRLAVRLCIQRYVLCEVSKDSTLQTRTCREISMNTTTTLFARCIVVGIQRL